MKICKYVFILFLSILFFNTCGIEDNVLSVQESKNLTYDETQSYLYFDGYNQEVDGGVYLFIGYDIHYYFTDINSAALAQIRNAYYITPHNFTDHKTEFQNYSSESRFSQLTVADKNNIFEWVTVPVTESMIINILKKGNTSNVHLYFKNYPNGNPTEEHSGLYVPRPYSGDKLFMDELYPNYSQYYNKPWNTLPASDPQQFRGFFDLKYYTNNGITPVSGTTNQFDIYFYVVAKSFNSESERTRSNVIESLKSGIIKVRITAS